MCGTIAQHVDVRNEFQNVLGIGALQYTNSTKRFCMYGTLVKCVCACLLSVAPYAGQTMRGFH